MGVYALTSFSGAPGVSTTAVAWAYASPRPTLILEADVTGGSPILAGLWGGEQTHDLSLLELANRQGERYADYLWEQALALPGAVDGWVVPTIGFPSQARSLAPVWAPLAEAARTISDQAGVDVLVDAGRLGTPGGPWPLVEAADVVLVLTDSTIAALNTTAICLESLRADLARSGTDQRVAVVPVLGDAGSLHTRPYTAKEIAHVTAPTVVLNGIPRDPRRAAVYSSTTPAARGHETSRYLRSIRALVTAAGRHAERCRALLGVGQEVAL